MTITRLQLKNDEGNFFPPLGFEQRFSVSKSQCATTELPWALLQEKNMVGGKLHTEKIFVKNRLLDCFCLVGQTDRHMGKMKDESKMVWTSWHVL